MKMKVLEDHNKRAISYKLWVFLKIFTVVHECWLQTSSVVVLSVQKEWNAIAPIICRTKNAEYWVMCLCVPLNWQKRTWIFDEVQWLLGCWALGGRRQTNGVKGGSHTGGSPITSSTRTSRLFLPLTV
jgi:hypothetical protein